MLGSTRLRDLAISSSIGAILGISMTSLRVSQPRPSSPHLVDGAGTHESVEAPIRFSTASSTAKAEEPIFVSNDLVQSVLYDAGERDLEFRAAERAPGSWDLVDAPPAIFSTSYVVKKIVPSGQAHSFFVNGRSRDGDDVLEQWDIDVGQGGRFATRPGGPTPIGTPSAPHSLTTGILGETYTQPSGRPRATATRTELYRGSDLGTLLGIAADPNGRFLLIVAGGALYRLDLGGAYGAPVEIDTGFSAIDSAVYVSIRELAATGDRAVVITALRPPGEGVWRYLMLDADNDGHFELPGFTYDQAGWSTLGLLDQEAWSQNYVEYF